MLIVFVTCIENGVAEHQAQDHADEQLHRVGHGHLAVTSGHWTQPTHCSNDVTSMAKYPDAMLSPKSATIAARL